MSPPPRRLQGSHLALGLLWPADRAPRGGEAWATLLQAGDRVLALDPAPPGAPAVVLLRFSRARRARADTAGADLVVPAGRGFTTLANPGDPGPGEVELAHGGQRFRVSIAGTPVPAARLLALEQPPLTVLEARGSPPAPPAQAAPDFGLVTRRLGLQPPADARAAHHAHPGSRSRLGDWLAALGGTVLREVLAVFRPGPQTARKARRGAPIGAAPRRFARMRGFFRGLGQFLGDLFAAGLAATAGTAAGLWSLLTFWIPRRDGPPRGPGPLRRAWRRLVSRLPSWSIFWALGARHGRLLQELLDRLRGDDLIEALRYAVPLGGAGDAPPEGWFFGQLQRRARFALGQRSAGGGLATSEQLVGLLRRMYEDAHRRLDAQGDTERAAWVLAELLRDKKGAVAYLEEKQELRLAAEWAELLELDTWIAVRLWIRAGRPTHAVELALARGMLGTTLAMLETSGQPEASALRLVWAHMLWNMGAPRAAIETAWVLPDDEPVPLESWVLAQRRAERQLPWSLAPALALGLVPDAVGALEEALGRGRAARAALARGVLTVNQAAGDRPERQVPTAGRAQVARALLEDLDAADQPRRQATVRLVQGLFEGQRGPELDLLERDLPGLGPPPSRKPRPLATGSHVLELAAPPRPGPVIQDAWVDEDGVLYAALGEAGMWVHLPGQAPRCWPVAVEALVCSASGVVGLGGPTRGVQQLWRIHAEGPPTAAGVLPAAALVLRQTLHDGVIWTTGPAGIGAWLLQHDGPRRIWSSGRDVGAVQALEVGPQELRAVTELDGVRELWRWERTDGPVLRLRQELRGTAPDAAGTAWVHDPRDDGDQRLRSPDWPEPRDSGLCFGLSFSGMFTWGPSSGVFLLHHSRGQLQLDLRATPVHSPQASLRPTLRALPGDQLLIWGRSPELVLVDLRSPAVQDHWSVG